MRRGSVRRAASALASERGQSTVEFALLLPAMMIAAVIGYNALMFFGECATFDRTVRNAVRVYASSEASAVSSDAEAQILSEVSGQVGSACEVEISSAYTSRGFTEYVATLSYTPTIFGRELRGEVFGVSLATLTHTCTFVIDTLVTG